MSPVCFLWRAHRIWLIPQNTSHRHTNNTVIDSQCTVTYWNYFTSLFLNKLQCELDHVRCRYLMSLCVLAECFCSVAYPQIWPLPLCVCVCVCVWFCCFCSNQTERRSVADVRGGVANSSSPPMRHKPRPLQPHPYFTSVTPHSPPLKLPDAQFSCRHRFERRWRHGWLQCSFS